MDQRPGLRLDWQQHSLGGSDSVVFLARVPTDMADNFALFLLHVFHEIAWREG